MKQRELPRFREERETYQLRYTCDQCTYFDPPTERCTHGYPNEQHRAVRVGEVGEPGELVFCKEFELM